MEDWEKRFWVALSGMILAGLLGMFGCFSALHLAKIVTGLEAERDSLYTEATTPRKDDCAVFIDSVVAVGMRSYVDWPAWDKRGIEWVQFPEYFRVLVYQRKPLKREEK